MQHQVERRGQGAERTAQGGDEIQAAGNLSGVFHGLYQQPHGVGRNHAENDGGHHEQQGRRQQRAVAGVFDLLEDPLHGGLGK